MTRSIISAAVAVAAGLWFAGNAPAQTVIYGPAWTASNVLYGHPYYMYPNSGYLYSYYPNRGYIYSNTYVGPTVYGPGYIASYPYVYNQLNYGYPYYNTYTYRRTFRPWRW